MADATPSRSNASREEKVRPAQPETTIVTFARLVGQSDELFNDTDKASSARFGKALAFDTIRTRAYSTVCQGQYDLLHMIPEGDDRDLMILAGHAAMLADQLPDFVGPNDAHAEKICEGIKAALATISAVLAQSWPAGPESVAPIYPELARSIRQDAMVTEARRDALRADREGL